MLPLGRIDVAQHKPCFAIHFSLRDNLFVDVLRERKIIAVVCRLRLGMQLLDFLRVIPILAERHGAAGG